MVRTNRLTQVVLFVFVCAGAVVSLYPLLWMVASSFKPEKLIFADKSLLIRQFTLENYIKGFKGIGGNTYLDYLRNTFVLVIPVVFANLLSCSMTGYAFARLRFFGKRVFFVLMLLTMMLPMHASLIPRYILFNKLGWINTFKPMIVPHFLAIGSFFVFLFVQFMRGIPRELDHAATVDGCDPIAIYWRIILPLSLPALLTTAIFTFIWTYDDFFSQLIYLNDPRKFTIALALRQYVEAYELSAFGTLFAMSAISLLPVMIFFISCQKYLVQGIVTTGLKG
jgi:multiple sugar transport system permease protein